MGLMFRAKLTAFLAGGAASSAAGFYFLYKDYKVAQQAISHQARDAYESLSEHYEALEKRVAALERQKEVETTETPELQGR